MNRYDELNHLIKHWGLYVALHRRIANSKHMKIAWHERMHKIELKVEQWKLERDLLCELNS